MPCISNFYHHASIPFEKSMSVRGEKVGKRLLCSRIPWRIIVDESFGARIIRDEYVYIYACISARVVYASFHFPFSKLPCLLLSPSPVSLSPVNCLVKRAARLLIFQRRKPPTALVPLFVPRSSFIRNNKSASISRNTHVPLPSLA